MLHNHRQGAKVNHTTPVARTTSLRTGIFAALRGVFGGGGGSGAPSRRPDGLHAGLTATLASLSLRSTVFRLVSAISILAFFAVGAAPASALTQRPYLSQIAGFTEPTGLSVDPADDLWVTDPGNAGLITELSPFPANAKIGEQDGEGHFTFGGGFILSAAFSAFNEHLYVGDSGEVVVHDFDAAGHWESTWTGFGSANLHVAVDNSGTASEGRVYVSQAEGGVIKAFKPNGEAEPFSAVTLYIEENKLIGTPTGPGETLEPFGEAWAITVGPDGDIYLADGIKQVVDQFEPSGQFVRQFTGAGSRLSAVAVDPTSGNVLAAEGAAILEFSPTGALEARITTANGASFTNIEGLAVDSAGNLYAADRGAGLVDVFGPAEPLPVETDGGSALSITATTATLRAQISPNGHHTSYAFLYGTADCVLDPGACTEVPSAPAALGNGKERQTGGGGLRKRDAHDQPTLAYC
jgi:sugar lactone lactonase YvrE